MPNDLFVYKEILVIFSYDDKKKLDEIRANGLFCSTKNRFVSIRVSVQLIIFKLTLNYKHEILN